MKFIYFVVFILLVTNCSVGYNYKPQNYYDYDKKNNSFYDELALENHLSKDSIEIKWWNNFKDKILNQYIDKAIKNNLDILVAENLIIQARAIRGINATKLFPKVNAQANANNETISKDGRLFGTITDNLPIINKSKLNNNYNVYDFKFDATWELDLFGGTKRLLEANKSREQQAMAFRNYVLLKVIADLARSYIELRAKQQQKILLQQIITIQQQIINIIKKQTQFGLINSLNLNQSKIELEVHLSKLPVLDSEIKSKIYQISLLVNEYPNITFTKLIKTRILPPFQDIVPIGLRSHILRRRPDVKIAERNLAIATADIGIAISKLYPSFSIFGSYGSESRSLSSLLTKDSLTSNFGLNLNFPIFNRKSIHSLVNLKKAQAKKATIEYEKAINQSLSDVESSIINYINFLKTIKNKKKTEEYAKQNVELLKQQYQLGLDNGISLFKSQQKLIKIQLEVLQTKTLTLISLIRLYKSLGGGWENNKKNN